MLRRTLMLLVPATLVAGCTPVDYGFGETHRWNIEQQVIDPDPEYEGVLIEGYTGRRAADAVDRYNRGEVKQPSVATSSSSGTGGAGAGAGASTSGSGPR